MNKLSTHYKKNTEILSLDFLLKTPIKRSVVFIMSDTMNIDEKSFKHAAIKHDIIFIHVSSYFENKLK
jgi:hypothetical protein